MGIYLSIKAAWKDGEQQPIAQLRLTHLPRQPAILCQERTSPKHSFKLAHKHKTPIWVRIAIGICILL